MKSDDDGCSSSGSWTFVLLVGFDVKLEFVGSRQFFLAYRALMNNTIGIFFANFFVTGKAVFRVKFLAEFAGRWSD